MHSREVEAELAKQDYVVMATLMSAPSDSQQTFDARMKAAANLRKVTRQVLNGDAFNPIILADRIRQEKERQEFDAKMLARVAALGEDEPT